MTTTKNKVLNIHGFGKKVVIAITGGGSEAIGFLLKHGFGSNTLLEALVPYNQAAFNQLVGRPDSYCSAEAAGKMAMAAFQKAKKLAPTEPIENLIGIGATCSLVKDHERQGREHRIFIAAQTITTSAFCQYEINLPTREAEENYAANKIIDSLHAACLDFTGMQIFNCPKGMEDLYSDTPTFCGLKTNLIFSGSFNPVHNGHLKMAEKVKEIFNKPTTFEVSIKNVEKPFLNYRDLQERKEQILSNIGDNLLIFSNAATFKEKSYLYPNSTFIVGYDTIKRIGDPTYYAGNDEREKQILMKNAIQEITDNNCDFLVFGRNSNQEDFENLPNELKRISKLTDFEIPPHSSSEIRKNREIK